MVENQLFKLRRKYFIRLQTDTIGITHLIYDYRLHLPLTLYCQTFEARVFHDLINDE